MLHRCIRRLLAVTLSVHVLATIGCAGPSSWTLFASKPDASQGITTPAERIAAIRETAGSAENADEATKLRISQNLCDSIRDEQDPSIRVAIIDALGKLPGPSSDAVLRAAATDPDGDVRIAACKAWADRGDSQAVAELGNILGGDVNPDVRLTAARELGRTKNEAAVAVLAPALEDEDPAMQYRAAESLEQITGKDFGGNVQRWQQYVKGEEVAPISVAERFWSLL